MLQQIGSNLWVTEHPVPFLGVPLTTRVTVLSLRAGELFVHSPVALDSEATDQLKALGAVTFVAALRAPERKSLSEAAG